MSEFKISDTLFLQLSEFYKVSTNKHKLPKPEEIRNSPFFVMVEILKSITDYMTKSDEESNELFSQYFSVCLRGINPFKDSVLKKAGVDPKIWKRIIKTVSGDY
jgi:hypothetical protein